MRFEDVSLEQLGPQADAHYVAGKRANDKAEQHLQSCGLYLIEAKARVAKRKDMTWPQYLKAHCQTIKSQSRADEVIRIVKGETTAEEVRASKSASAGKAQAKAREDARKFRQSALISVGSAQIPQQNQQPVPEATSDRARADVMARIMAKLAKLSIDQLKNVERLIPNVH